MACTIMGRSQRGMGEVELTKATSDCSAERAHQTIPSQLGDAECSPSSFLLILLLGGGGYGYRRYGYGGGIGIGGVLLIVLLLFLFFGFR